MTSWIPSASKGSRAWFHTWRRRAKELVYQLDFVAAGPFSYNHTTGVGGVYADRNIGKTTGVVERRRTANVMACGKRISYIASESLPARCSSAAA